MEDENYKEEAKRAASYIIDKAYYEGYRRGSLDMSKEACKILYAYPDFNRFDNLIRMAFVSDLKKARSALIRDRKTREKENES